MLDQAAPLNPLRLQLGPLQNLWDLGSKAKACKAQTMKHYTNCAEQVRLKLEVEKRNLAEVNLGKAEIIQLIDAQSQQTCLHNVAIAW